MFDSNVLNGNIFFNGELVKEFEAEFPVKYGLKRNKFFGGGVLVLGQQQVTHFLNLNILLKVIHL